jgi:hypothetical protein
MRDSGVVLPLAALANGYVSDAGSAVFSVLGSGINVRGISSWN